MRAITAIKEQPFQLGTPLTIHPVDPGMYSAPPVLWEKTLRLPQREPIEPLMSLKGNQRQRKLLFTALLLAVVPVWTQTATPGPAPGEEVIAFLDKTVTWYHHSTAEQQLVRDSGDLLFFNDSRQAADQIVRLSFDFARARAKTLPSQATATVPSEMASASTQYQKLTEAAAKADQQVQQSQQEIDGLRRKLPGTSGKKRTTLQATIAETEGELELFQARRDALRSMLQVSNGRPGAGTNLPAQVEELARTVPGATTDKEPGGSSASPANPNLAPAEHKAPSGILALISDLMTERRRMEALDDNLRETDSLAQAAQQLRAPMGQKLRELAQTGDALAAQPDSTDPAVLAQQKKDLDALTAQYKEVSATLLPLGRQSILFDIYKGGITNWRNAVKGQYQSEVKGLVLRLAGLGMILAVIFAIAELWRRATFRYITDTRRRYQFLALRRFVVWSLVALIIAIAFASELGAITTFAGFLTAGIAVALQNV